MTSEETALIEGMLYWLRDETLVDMANDIRCNMGFVNEMDERAQAYLDSIESVRLARETGEN